MDAVVSGAFSSAQINLRYSYILDFTTYLRDMDIVSTKKAFLQAMTELKPKKKGQKLDKKPISGTTQKLTNYGRLVSLSSSYRKC